MYDADFFSSFGDSLLALGKELKKNGDQMIICFPRKRNWMRVFEQEGFQLEIIPMQKIFDFRAIKVLSNLLKKHRIDIVHTHFGLESQVIGCLAKFFTSHKIKIVWHWRSPLRSDILEREKISVFLRMKFFFGNPLYRGFDKCCVSKHVVISNEIYNILLARKITKQKKIKIIYNGIDIDKYNLKVIEQQTIPLQDINVPLIGNISNFNPPKDHFTFLLAAKLVLKKYSQAKFMLVGDGPTQKEVENYGKKLGINSNLLFMGTQSDVRGFIKACDFTVLSSLHEGFGNVACESLALECPVVATRVGGIPIIVRDNETGFLVPLKDPKAMAERILYLIEHPLERIRLGKNGRKLVKQKFTTRRWAQEMRSVFMDVLGNS